MPKTSRKLILAVTAGCGAAMIVRRLARQARLDTLRGKIVVITGGSRGLGLLLAREFGRQGCRVAICSRNADQLDRARDDLKSRGIEVWARACDVTDAAQVQKFVSELTSEFGPVGVLVNNAGIIQVGPVNCMKPEDFDQALKTIFWGALNMIFAVLPEMQRQRDGRIVNITSVGGKVSVPHLLPYACAKFALVALSEGLSAELARDGIRVTTIVPGLMRTGSHVNALFKGRQHEESTWFGLSASSPLVSVNAERAARAIVRAAQCGATERTISLPAKFIARLQGVFPGATISFLSLINQLILPSWGGGEATAKPGRDVSAPQVPLLQALMHLGRTAAERYNQL